MDSCKVVDIRGRPFLRVKYDEASCWGSKWPMQSSGMQHAVVGHAGEGLQQRVRFRRAAATSASEQQPSVVTASKMLQLWLDCRVKKSMTTCTLTTWRRACVCKPGKG